MIHAELSTKLSQQFDEAKISSKYEITKDETVDSIEKFISVDFPLIYSSYKQLVSPPFKMDEPIMFIKVTSAAIQKWFYFLEGTDRRKMVISVVKYLGETAFKNRAPHLAWLTDEVFVGFVYDFFVRGR